jgi:hypothetical protein
MLHRVAFIIALLSSSFCIGALAYAQSDVLPAIGADGLTVPLTVEQLDDSERATYTSLSADTAAATRFLYTRGYFRYCRLVAAKKLEASRLPPLPSEKHWDRAYLNAEEGRTADFAMGLWMISTMRKPGQ